jgi:hypothetical protein
MKIIVPLTVFVLLTLSACTTAVGTRKIANEWCSCIGDLDENTPKIASKQCDSLAEAQLELIVQDKWREVEEKKLSIDTIRAFKLSLHMEYYKMTEKCRKSKE